MVIYIVFNHFGFLEIMFVLYLLAEEYDRHMAGKRHNERLQAYIEKKKTAECSVFVKGFPPRTAEDELMLYFQSFGMINKIVMEIHEKKKVCQGFQYFSSLPVQKCTSLFASSTFLLKFP